MKHSAIKKLSLIATLTFALSSFAYSADIVRTLSNNADENNEAENFFEIGVGGGAGVGSSLYDEDAKGAGFNGHVRGSYNWNGFFIDLFGETSEAAVVGYNAYNSDTWSFDVVLGHTLNGITQDNDEDGRFEGLNKREGSLFFGGRATSYFGKNIIQLSLKHDVSGRSQATIVSALVGRNWQHRNWNFHGFVRLDLADAKLADYFLGVTEEEASRTNFEAFNGEASVNLSSSIGVTYPITEHWVYRAGISAGSNFGKNDSPLFAKRRSFYAGIGTSISYVF